MSVGGPSINYDLPKHDIFPLCQKWASKNATKTKQKRQALCAKRSCYQRLNSEFLPVCLKRPVVHQSSCVFDRLLLSLMFVCEKDDRCLIFECILSCYGQCKVVKCCLCTVCLMSHIFMYSNIHTQCIIHLLL